MGTSIWAEHFVVAVVLLTGCERADEQRVVDRRPSSPVVRPAGEGVVVPVLPGPTSEQHDVPPVVIDKSADPIGSNGEEGCGGQLTGTPPADLYRALVLGTEDQKGVAALAVLKNRSHQAQTVVARAITVIAAHPYCPQLHPLTDTLQDPAMDDITRASAALALGVIARDFPCTFPSGSCPQPHDPIPQWSKKALRDCAVSYPMMVRRGCVEALGYVHGTDESFLATIRDSGTQDGLVRVFAGRALTRLTGTKQVSADSLQSVMADAKKVAHQ
ncbi:MAG: hypothetical protein JO257_18600 [Deltaproteobacteria bacterium]|nr:hypothetical protein [Deltaproteobacteria bacterium]